ncbi:MAG: hypothetical protein IPL31_08005 [Saprospiraceae bacterium]|nr:hypothetical protein [Saprospiraceae bacterium]
MRRRIKTPAAIAIVFLLLDGGGSTTGFLSMITLVPVVVFETLKELSLVIAF